MTLARIPSAPHSCAITFVSDTSAALLTLYRPSPASGEMPPMLDTFTMAPPRCAITVWAVLQSSSGPFTFTAKIFSKASSLASCSGPNTGLVAALFTMISMPSKCSTVRAANSCASAAFPILAGMPTTSRPSSRSSFTAASTWSAFRLEITTFAPARASVVAMANPIPRVPPVTIATFPSRRNRDSASVARGVMGSCMTVALVEGIPPILSGSCQPVHRGWQRRAPLPVRSCCSGCWHQP